MKETYEILNKCLNQIREKTDFVPKIALVLGSGLGDFANNIEITAFVEYKSLEGFPVSTVTGHAGRFVFGYLNSVPVVVMQGRVHYYEGYKMSDVVMPVRLMAMLGAKVLFLTNAAGGINTGFSVGGLMLIKGQISSFVPSPLIGNNVDEMGLRFPDMSEIYDKKLQKIIKKTAKEQDTELFEGTYLQTTGPNYESPEEIVMYGRLGADAVGMSTACEAIAARHMGMKICGISCISNMAAGISKTPLTHEEVQKAADKAGIRFKKLVTAAITNIYQEAVL